MNRRRRKIIAFNAKLMAVGAGMLMLSAKLQSYGSAPTISEVREVRVEAMEAETEQIVIPVTKAEISQKYDFSLYQVPFGELPEDIQIYTHEICEQYGVSTEVVFAIMQYESRFNSEAVGDNGQSFGYMQVMEKWHVDRMKKLGVSDLKNPEENILVAVDYLSELKQIYGDMTSVLMAYNCGPTTAQKLWKQGIWQTGYTREVLQCSENIHSYIYGGAE